jgi:hypothetical protein
MAKRATTVLLVCLQAAVLGPLAAGCAALRSASDDYAEPARVRGDAITYRLRWPGDDPILDASHYCARLHRASRLLAATNTTMSFDCVSEPEAATAPTQLP